jgi:hypothetical protein
MRDSFLRGRGRGLVIVDDENAQKSDDFYGSDDMNMQQYEAMVRIFGVVCCHSSIAFIVDFKHRGYLTVCPSIFEASLSFPRLRGRLCVRTQVFMSVLIGMFVCCFCSCLMKRLQRVFEASSEARAANEVLLRYMGVQWVRIMKGVYLVPLRIVGLCEPRTQALTPPLAYASLFC